MWTSTVSGSCSSIHRCRGPAGKLYPWELDEGPGHRTCCQIAQPSSREIKTWARYVIFLFHFSRDQSLCNNTQRRQTLPRDKTVSAAGVMPGLKGRPESSSPRGSTGLAGSRSGRVAWSLCSKASKWGTSWGGGHHKEYQRRPTIPTIKGLKGTPEMMMPGASRVKGQTQKDPHPGSSL